jgi:DNA-directed RNA polymerase subunit RPC12/RpoP
MPKINESNETVFRCAVCGEIVTLIELATKAVT